MRYNTLSQVEWMHLRLFHGRCRAHDTLVGTALSTLDFPLYQHHMYQVYLLCNIDAI